MYPCFLPLLYITTGSRPSTRLRFARGFAATRPCELKVPVKRQGPAGKKTLGLAMLLDSSQTPNVPLFGRGAATAPCPNLHASGARSICPGTLGRAHRPPTIMYACNRYRATGGKRLLQPEHSILQWKPSITPSILGLPCSSSIHLDTLNSAPMDIGLLLSAPTTGNDAKTPPRHRGSCITSQQRSPHCRPLTSYQ